MTVSQYMNALSLGKINISDGGYVLGINFSGADSPDGYLVFAAGAAQIKAEILSDIGRKKYVVGGAQCRRRSAVRRFTVLMDRVHGDPLQDFLLSCGVMFGCEHQCVFDYVYFSAASKCGEKGRVTVNVTVDSDGSPDDVSAVSAELFGFGGAPEDYIYREVQQ
ncbi:MAG: phage tail tube protein [Oscillospiraceae bacterium]